MNHVGAGNLRAKGLGGCGMLPRIQVPLHYQKICLEHGCPITYNAAWPSSLRKVEIMFPNPLVFYATPVGHYRFAVPGLAPCSLDHCILALPWAQSLSLIKFPFDWASSGGT